MQCLNAKRALKAGREEAAERADERREQREHEQVDAERLERERDACRVRAAQQPRLHRIAKYQINQISSIPVQNYEYRTDECICKSTSTQELELGSRNQSKSCGRVNDELRTCTCTSAGGGEGSGAHESVGQRDVVVGGLEGRIELTLGQSSVRRRVVLNRTREVLEAAQVHADLSTQKKRVALISAILSKNVKSDDSRLFMCSARAVGGF